MRNRLIASCFFGLLVLIVCAFGYNFAQNLEWFEVSIRQGIAGGICFFLGAVLGKYC